MAKDAKAARKEGRLGRGPVALDVLLLQITDECLGHGQPAHLSMRRPSHFRQRNRPTELP